MLPFKIHPMRDNGQKLGKIIVLRVWLTQLAQNKQNKLYFSESNLSSQAYKGE